MVLPLRVWWHGPAGEPLPSQWAHTIEISPIGCRLGGLHNQLSTGQTITLQRGQHKAAFRVVWSRQLEANENQAGIEALDYEKDIWAVELPPLPTEVKNSLQQISDEIPSEDVLKEDILREEDVPGNSDTPAVAKKISAHISAQTSAKTPKKISAVSRARLRWGFGFLLLAVALGLSLYSVTFDAAQMAVHPRVPSVPTARDLARLAPRPHPAPALSKNWNSAAPYIKVAEAPTAHIVYPDPPSSVSGQVRLQIVIAANGLVKQIHALSGNPSLAEAAARAIRLWHYSPFQGNNPSIDRETSVTVSFLGPDAVFLQFPSNPAQVNPTAIKTE